MRNGFAPIYDNRSAWEMQNSVGFGWSIFVTFLYRVLWRICDIEACVKLSVTSWEIIQRYIIAEPSECSFYNQLLPFQIIKSNPRAIHIKLQKTPMKQQQKNKRKKKASKVSWHFVLNSEVEYEIRWPRVHLQLWKISKWLTWKVITKSKSFNGKNTFPRNC